MIGKQVNKVRVPVLIAALCLVCCTDLQAQDSNAIALPGELRDSAIVYTYRMDRLINGLMKSEWKKPLPLYGPYALQNYSRDITEFKAGGNFFGTKFDQTEMRTWAYELHAEGRSPKDVEIVYNFSESLVSSLQPFDNIPISFGEDELLALDLHVSVFIGFGSGDPDPWMLLISVSDGSRNESGYKWLLTNGKRKIDIEPVKNEVRSEFKKNFAMFLDIPRGFVFREQGKGVAAMQWCAYNRQKHTRVWMHPSLDPDLQMSLSASISAILLLIQDGNFRNEVISRVWF